MTSSASTSGRIGGGEIAFTAHGAVLGNCDEEEVVDEDVQFVLQGENELKQHRREKVKDKKKESKIE